jgi:hypothetical protein
MSVSLPSIPVALLRAPEGSDLKAREGQSVPLSELLNGKKGVIDLWHTKCTRCPAALEKLNDIVTSTSSIGIACALSQGPRDVDTVNDLIQDTWENLAIIFVEEEHKDSLKAAFGYSAVPFYIFFNVTGQVVKSGDGKSINVESDLALTSSAGTNGLNFDEDF